MQNQPTKCKTSLLRTKPAFCIREAVKWMGYSFQLARLPFGLCPSVCHNFPSFISHKFYFLAFTCMYNMLFLSEKIDKSLFSHGQTLYPPLTMTIDCPCLGIFGGVTVISQWIITALWSYLFFDVIAGWYVASDEAQNTVYWYQVSEIDKSWMNHRWCLLCCFSFNKLASFGNWRVGDRPNTWCHIAIFCHASIG